MIDRAQFALERRERLGLEVFGDELRQHESPVLLLVSQSIRSGSAVG
jgi:hypothetical protein